VKRLTFQGAPSAQRNRILIAVICALACQRLAPAQTTSQASASIQTVFSPQSFPLQLQGAVMALGTRLQKPGQERETLAGTITNSTGSSPGKVTFELPNKVRIDWMGATGRSIGYDGTSNWASDGMLSEQDQNLLETFLEDSPEGMLNSVRQTASLRVIATYARFDNGSTPNYAGPLVDIFQVVEPVASNGAKPMRQKHYYFDSTTRLLTEVDYLESSDGATVGVRVQRSNWNSVGGQLAPGTVTRIENGTSVFSLGSATATFSPAAADGTFSAP
jgi:hypothetical protein